MKSLKQILVAIFVLTFIVVSCNKDKNDPKETLEKAAISAKWIVSGSNEYESFEFNESGNYIVVKNLTTKSTNDQIILFGTYEIIDNKTIVLSDFGTLTISEINENSISFSIHSSSYPDNDIVITASKQEEMENSTNTELLCRTWKMVSVNGVDVADTEYELSVLFSKAGTYFVEYANSEDEDAGGLAHWKWSDNSETKFLYSWETPPVWEEEDIVEVIELTNNSLKILDRFGENEEELYELVPVVNTKSAKYKSNVNGTMSDKQLKAGFLKK